MRSATPPASRHAPGASPTMRGAPLDPRVEGPPMADVVHFRFRLRGGTAAEWTASNPILMEREPGIETNTARLKFGDGVTPWRQLPYAAQAEVDALGMQLDGLSYRMNVLESTGGGGGGGVGGVLTPDGVDPGTFTAVDGDTELVADGNDPGTFTVTSTGEGGGVTVLPWFDATNYGADKTGTTDSAPAINAAVAAANAAGGGIVHLPAGDYRIEYSANAGGLGVAGGVQMRGNVWLRGEGRGTRLFPAGTWSTRAGIIGIGDYATTRGSNTMYNVRVSDLFIKGVKGPLTGGTRTPNTVAVLFNTYNGSSVLEPDAAHVVHDLLIWDMDQGMVFIGEDDQGMSIHRIRIRRCLASCVQIGKTNGSGGGPDNYFFNIDASSANSGHAGNAVFEIYSANCHFVQCKAWYAKRSTAFSTASTYLDGAGFYIAGTRNTLVACEAQDNGGHGFILRYGYNTLSACIADSNSYYDCVSGSAATNECSGVFITGGASNSSVEGLITFNRSAAHRDQKHGVLINSSVRAINVSGTGYDNAAAAAGGTAADTVVWTGNRNATQRVEVTTSYAGDGYDVILNPAEAGGGGGVVSTTQEITKTATNTLNTVTGTTLTDDAALKLTGITGGAVRYKVEASIFYRADAATDGRLAIRPTIVTGTGTFELYGVWDHQTTTGALAQTTAYSSATGTLNHAVVDGAGTTGTSNIRQATFNGSMYAGSSITAGAVAVALAENAAGTGMTIIEGSWLRITRA